MSNKTIEAVLRLSSKLGSMAAFSKVGKEMAKVDRQARAYSRTQAMVAKSTSAAWATTARYVGPVVAGFASVQSVKNYAQTERHLSRIGLTIGASRREMEAINGMVKQNAKAFALPSSAILETVDAYAAAGASLADMRSDLGLLVEAQQALDASGRDIVSSWDAARKSLGLASSDARRFFELVAAGGAAGKFEAKDMARELPALLPIAARLGVAGTEGAASLIGFLEVAADFAGSAGQAATMTSDLLDKITSPDVIKRFKAINIDLPRSLAKSRREGEDLFAALHKIITQATGGDAQRLGEFFGDKEARAAAGVVLTHFERIKAAQDEVRRNAPGVLAENNKRVLEDAQAGLDRLAETMKQLAESAGRFVVNLGAADGAAAIGDYLDYATAVNAGLEKSGVHGFAARSFWGMRNNQRAKDQMAWIGGYRTDHQRKLINDYADAAAKRRASAEAAAGYVDGIVLPSTPTDRFDMPIHGPTLPGRPAIAGGGVPLPSSRQEALDALPREGFERDYRNQLARRFTHRAAEHSSMRALDRMRGRGDVPSTALDDWIGMGGKSVLGDLESRLDRALSSGGEQAGEAMKSGGDEAGAALKAAANEVARVLRGAAAAFGAAVGRVNAARVSGDVGRTGATPGDL